jgi:serine/threonine-protein kinase
VANEADRYHVGTTISGRYCVEHPIGEGAMGCVALARHVSLDETVAIKFLKPELRRDPLAIARLSREARALARIKSDHVARVLDVGATLTVGPYMVMEYLEGTDLGELLEAEGPLPVARVVEISMQLCEALTVAHTAGIVHRDIKPQNLFLARHGRFETLKVLDFGISEDEPGSAAREHAEPPAANPSPPAALYGTPSYMSPERIRNEPTVDHRADIWSVGVVLHELVTGRAVFDAPTTTETCARVISGAPLELERDDTVLPASLRNIIARCLERDPSRRYPSVEELAAALAPLGSMTERFRGRSTGAFSRKFVEEQLAHSRAQQPELAAPVAAPPTAGEVSIALRDIGTALRSVLGAVPLARAYDRPLWQYGAIALASVLAVVVATSLGGNVDWVSPPSVSVRGEPLEPGERHAVRGLDEPTPAAQPPGAALPTSELADDVAAQHSVDAEHEPVAALEDSTPAAATGHRASRAHRAHDRAKAARKSARRKRAAAQLPLMLDDTRAELAPEELAPEAPTAEGRKPKTRLRRVPERVRLVTNAPSSQHEPRKNKAKRQRGAARASASTAPDAEDQRPAWLEQMRSGSDPEAP